MKYRTRKERILNSPTIQIRKQIELNPFSCDFPLTITFFNGIKAGNHKEMHVMYKFKMFYSLNS